MAAPDLYEFTLKNDNRADTVYPMVFDKSGTKVLWDGSVNPANEVFPGASTPFDLNIVSPPIPNQTVVILGCRVQGSKKDVKDPNSPRTFVKTSQRPALGTYLPNGTFVVDPSKGAGLDTAAFQDAYLKLNNPAVAKLLVAVASLISPEIAEIA